MSRTDRGVRRAGGQSEGGGGRMMREGQSDPGGVPLTEEGAERGRGVRLAC